MIRNARLFLSCITIVVMLLLPGVSSADDPTRIQFQGFLTDADGPVDGAVSLVFRLYTGPAISAPIIWGESHPAVTVARGIYSVLLGSGDALGGSPSVPSSLDSIDLTLPELWLEVSVNGQVVGERQRLSSVVYALHADTLDGKDASAFAPDPHSHSSLDASDGVPAEALIIDNEGKVGIGIPNPGYTLDVQTSQTSQYIAQFKYTGSYGNGYGLLVDTYGTGIRPALRVNTARGTVFNVTGDGKVEIGKDSPFSALDVNGTVTATSFVGDGSNLTGIAGSSPWMNNAGGIHYDGGDVGIGTTTPNVDLHVEANDGVLFSGVFGSGIMNNTGAGTRMMWYPGKAAFRAGGVSDGQWDDASIGPYSLAGGYNTQATGWYSTALGTESVAGDYAAVALGDGSSAMNMGSVAIGGRSNANGFFSTSIGYMNTTDGSYSTAMGNSTVASGDYSMAFGAFTNAESGYEIVMGRYDTDYTPVSSSGWDPSDRLFVIGNGSSNNQRFDAMVVLKNGDTTIDGNLTAVSFDGDGSGLRNVNAATVSVVDWNQIIDVPTGLDDGDDVGIVAENDPQVDDNIALHYVPKWTGTSLGAGSIYDYNGRVGIGTDFPLANFVLHAADATLLIEADGSGEEARLNLRNEVGNYGGFLLNNDTNWFQIGYRSAGADWGAITIPTSGANRGNVGIGTTTPGAKLEVIGDIAVSGRVDGRDIAADGAVLDGLQSSAGSGDTTNDSWSGVTDVYTISGSVGIGTTSPGAKLEVVGDISVSGTVDGRDIAADGAVLDALSIGDGADTTNDAWSGLTNVYTLENVMIGSSATSSHKLNVMANSAGSSAVRGVDYDLNIVNQPVTASDGQLGIGSPAGLPGSPTSVGVLGRKLSTGGMGVGVYGLNSDAETSNYAMYAVANGSATIGSNYGLRVEASGSHSVGTNYGIYAKSLGASNWAGYFDGNLNTTGRLEVTNTATIGGALEVSADATILGGELKVNGTGSAEVPGPGLVLGNDQGTPAKLYHTPLGLQMQAPNGRFQFGSSENIRDCGSYCVSLSSGNTTGGQIELTGRLFGDSTNPNVRVGSDYLLVEGAGSEKAYIGSSGAFATVEIGSWSAEIDAVDIFNKATSSYMHLTVGSLGIKGGADLSEPFDSTAPPDMIKPGMLMSVDTDEPGKLRISDQPYDKTVVGIVSGAGGVKPGLTMGQTGTEADGSIPIALTGRVYAWADASYGEIEPGDMLTTSDTPGHAMKVRDFDHAHGTIIGKAMTPLKEGQGLVLVVVALQ